MVDKDNGLLELKKHVNAIHCSNNLTLIQRKLFNALLYKAYSDLPNKSRFQISARELCNLIGYNSHDYGKLKAALLGLIKITIEWNVIDCQSGIENQWKASSILASAELARGVCYYEYSHVMRELLYHPEIYGRININLVAKFKSSYGLALYENCIRYQGLSQTPWFTIDVFRKLMGVLDSKYTVFSDFKKRVLNNAIDEVNAIAPIHLIPDIERINNKVTRIRFKFIKSKQDDNIPYPNQVDEPIEGILINVFGLSLNIINDILQRYDIEYIKEKMDFVLRSDSFISGKIRGVSGFFVEALKKDYKPNKSSKYILKEVQKQNLLKAKIDHDKQEHRKNRYNKYVNEKLETYLSSLTETQYTELLFEFALDMEKQSSMFRKWYEKDGLGHPAIRSLFNNFVKDRRYHHLGNLLSFDDFVKTVEAYN